MEKTIDFIFELLKSFLISIVVVVLIINFIAIPVRVSGSSMYPNLHEGDFGFSGVFTRALGYKRFDVVVLENDATQQKIVKRIIGLPNEKVEYKNSQLYINDEAVEEDFLGEDIFTNNFVVELGNDEYFCLGDNREVSQDSRYYGPFSSKDIVAKSILVLYPFRDMGLY